MNIQLILLLNGQKCGNLMVGIEKIKVKNMVPIKNKELVIELYNLYNKYPIRFKHVKSHQRKPLNENSEEYFEWYGNMMADKLAKNSISL